MIPQVTNIVHNLSELPSIRKTYSLLETLNFPCAMQKQLPSSNLYPSSRLQSYGG